jgi:hypothetical protein
MGGMSILGESTALVTPTVSCLLPAARLSNRSAAIIGLSLAPGDDLS